MKKIFALLLGLFSANHIIAQNSGLSASLDMVKLEFKLNIGKPEYLVYYGRKPVIKPSEMGFKLTNNTSFTNSFIISSSETKTVDTTRSPVWGEANHIHNHYRQLTVHPKQNNPGRAIDIVFRVFSDGVGFRYIFLNLLASKLTLNLNDPSKFENTSWIKPMKFVGVWWEMQTGKGTWAYSCSDYLLADGKLIPTGIHIANTANVIRYINFADKNSIKGFLVAGRNTGREYWFGFRKENFFSFVTSYPDFDSKELTRYQKA
ncbi:glycoside hydrolase family 97 N-terminal domain-containing protein [Mucilaginibacter sp.]|uniref:glycoside hydrolase family 97 N-terminal domain-containing protein n=1 Tax=Mucilaginibacter sp. TaxID=1882438 RepID=UPI003B00B2BC